MGGRVGLGAVHWAAGAPRDTRPRLGVRAADSSLEGHRGRDIAPKPTERAQARARRPRLGAPPAFLRPPPPRSLPSGGRHPDGSAGLLQRVTGRGRPSPRANKAGTARTSVLDTSRLPGSLQKRCGEAEVPSAPEERRDRDSNRPRPSRRPPARPPPPSSSGGSAAAAGALPPGPRAARRPARLGGRLRTGSPGPFPWNSVRGGAQGRHSAGAPGPRGTRGLEERATEARGAVSNKRTSTVKRRPGERTVYTRRPIPRHSPRV